MEIKDWLLLGDRFSFRCKDIPMTWSKDRLERMVKYFEAYDPEGKVEDKNNDHKIPVHHIIREDLEDKTVNDPGHGRITLGFRFTDNVYDYMTCDQDGKITISDEFAEAFKAKIMPKDDSTEGGFFPKVEKWSKFFEELECDNASFVKRRGERLIVQDYKKIREIKELVESTRRILLQQSTTSLEAFDFFYKVSEIVEGY